MNCFFPVSVINFISVTFSFIEIYINEQVWSRFKSILNDNLTIFPFLDYYHKRQPYSSYILIQDLLIPIFNVKFPFMKYY